MASSLKILDETSKMSVNYNYNFNIMQIRKSFTYHVFLCANENTHLLSISTSKKGIRNCTYLDTVKFGYNELNVEDYLIPNGYLTT